MKIEKLSDNQIRCTLTREDLAMRHLKISELAYGTEKTQNLFREMIREADFEYGFGADNMPLMIEAIPMNTDSIVLIITKVDDPEELDTRFSRFSPNIGDTGEDAEDSDEDLDPEEVMDLINQQRKTPAKPVQSFSELLEDAVGEQADSRIFLFTLRSIQNVMDLAAAVGSFAGSSRLYKDNGTGEYLLALQRGKETVDRFRQVCQIAYEFGTGRSIPAAGDGYLAEHCEVLIDADAIGKLS